MSGKEKASEHERRDWTVILIILLFGFLCVILAGQWALRFAPRWKLDTSMQSNLDPNSDFLTSRPVNYFEPLDPSILTQPAWINVFLTPGAFFETRTPVPVTNTPLGTNTPIPTMTSSPIATKPATNTPMVILPSPTNTAPYFPPPPATNTPVTSLPSADLSLTKSDGLTNVNPGAIVTYTVRVTNNGPDNVTGATLSDPVASGLSKTAVACSPTPGQCSIPPTVIQLENGNFVLPALNNGQFYEINVTTNVTASNGNVTNTATVTAPAGITDPTGNNSASDTDTVNLGADLSISKTSPSTTYGGNGTVLYTITVTNAGPSAAIGATVTDTFPSQATATWTCSPAGGATCPLVGSGNINDTVNLPAASSLTYIVSVVIDPNPSGDLVNTAAVIAPPGVTDTNPGNNSSTYTHSPYIDVQITKDDGGMTTYTAPGPHVYTVTVTNNSTFDLTGVTVTDNIPSLITDWAWSCTSQNGGASGCSPAASNSSNFTDSVDLPANGSSIVYTVTANIHPFAAGNLVNTATVSVPSGYVDAVPGNNSATDTNINQSGEPEVGPPDGGTYDIPDNGSATFYLSQPIIANNDTAPDFVFYEMAIGSDIYLDQIIIEISPDGATWYQVFFWGNAAPDTNTNVNNAIPPINGVCPTEADNCQIPSAYLYNVSGITINVDAFAPAGNHYWIRFTEPGITPGDGTHVDSIEILP